MLESIPLKKIIQVRTLGVLTYAASAVQNDGFPDDEDKRDAREELTGEAGGIIAVEREEIDTHTVTTNWGQHDKNDEKWYCPCGEFKPKMKYIFREKCCYNDHK